MRGSITKTVHGYQVVVDQGRDPLSGKRRRKAATFATKAEAEHALPGMLQAARAKTPAPKSLTVGEMLDRWLGQVGADLSPNTLRGYHKKVDGYLRPAFGDLRLGKLSPARVDSLWRAMREKGYAVSTVRQTAACLSGACELALRWGWLAENPVLRAKPPTAPRRDVEGPPVKYVAAALVECGQDTLEVAWLAIASGARRGELAGVQWADLADGKLVLRRSVADDLSVVVEHRKSRIRTVALDRETVKMLERRRKRAAEDALCCGQSLGAAGFVFAEEPGQKVPLKPERITGRWRDACKRAGVQVRFHDLRHLSVSTLLGAGLSVVNVASRHGHGAAVMLSTYAHAMPSVDDQAAEIMGDLVQSLTRGR